MAIAGFAHKKTLITGAARGIGRSTALAAACEGAELVLADVDKARLEDAVEEMNSQGGSVLMAEAFDVADVDAVTAFAETVRTEIGSLDVIMNIGVTLVCPGAVDTPLVGTVDIVGVDRDDPKVQRAMADFQRHAVTPDQAANAILKGVERGTCLVFTSRDIRIGHWAQRFFPFGYRFAMRRLNTRVQELVDRP